MAGFQDSILRRLISESSGGIPSNFGLRQPSNLFGGRRPEPSNFFEFAPSESQASLNTPTAQTQTGAANSGGNQTFSGVLNKLFSSLGLRDQNVESNQVQQPQQTQQTQQAEQGGQEDDDVTSFINSIFN